MTTQQRTANAFTENLSDTENGLIVYDSDENKFYYWSNPNWVEVGSNIQLAAGEGILIENNTISNLGDADADPANEIQDLQISGTEISLSGNNNPTVIDLASIFPEASDNQDLSFISGQISLTGDPDATVIDLSNYDSDVTDDFSGDFGDLTGIPANLDLDATDDVTLASFPNLDTDNTDDVTLTSFPNLDTDNTDDITTADIGTGANQVVQLDGAGRLPAVDGSQLTNLPAGGDMFTTTYDTDVDGVVDNAANASTVGGFTVGVSVPAGADFTDDQTLSVSGGGLNISGGNSIELGILQDGFEPNTDQQDLQFNANQISLTGDPDNTIMDLSGFDTDASDDLTLPINETLNNAGNIFQLNNSGAGGVATLRKSGDNTNPVLTLTDDVQGGPAISANTGIVIGNLGPDLTGGIRFNAGNFEGNVDGTPAGWVSLSASGFSGDWNDLSNIPAGFLDGTDEVDDADADATNELLTLGSLSGTTLRLFEGANNLNVDLSALADLPGQSGNAGRFLTTDGTAPSWVDVPSSPWGTSGSGVFYTAGNVGIGSAPSALDRLLVFKDMNDGEPLLSLESESDDASFLEFSSDTKSNAFTVGVDGGGNNFRISNSETFGTNDRVVIN